MNNKAAFWKACNKYGVAVYFFTAGGRYQISLNIGDQVQIEEELENWFKGYILTSGGVSVPKRRGIFPKCYIKIVDSLSPVPNDQDVILHQIYQVVEEWGASFKSFYREGRMVQFNALKERITLLLEMRRQILASTTPPEIRDALKAKAVSKIDELRSLLGTDITVHTQSGQLADEANTGIVALYHLHQQYEEKEKKKNKTPLVRILNVNTPFNNSSPITPTKQIITNSPQLTIPPNNQSNSKAKSKKDDIWRKSLSLARQQTIGYSVNNSRKILSSSINLGEKDPMNHILLELKVLMVMVGEMTEIYFSLWSSATGLFLTEEYQVQMTGQGMPVDLSKLGKLKTLFTDIPSRELSSDLFLVLRIIRRGNLAPDPAGSKKSGPGANFRRPYGVAVLPLASKSNGDPILVANREIEHIIKVYMPNQENAFATVHEAIIKNNFQGSKTGPFMEIPNSKGVCVVLTLYQGNLDEVVKTNQSQLDGVCQLNRLLIPDTAPPNHTRHDLYITLDSADLIKDKTSSAKNCQVSVSLRNADSGEVIRDCLSIGRGENPAPEVESFILTHLNTPHWGETICVKLPVPKKGELDQLKNVILQLSLSHCQDKSGGREEFAQAFLKLSKEDGSVVDDGFHVLPTFKPSLSRDPLFFQKEEGKNSLRKGESVKVKALLTSTYISSNPYVHQLLQWKTTHPNLESIDMNGLNEVMSPSVEEALRRFAFVEPTEIVKFLPDIFDAIFGIMSAYPTNLSLLLLCYDAVIFVFGLLTDERAKQGRVTRLGPVLDLYLETQFRHQQAHKRLIFCLKHHLSKHNEPGTLSKIITSFKSLAYFFKFTIASRLEYNKNPNRSSLRLGRNPNISHLINLTSKETPQTPSALNHHNVTLGPPPNKPLPTPGSKAPRMVNEVKAVTTPPSSPPPPFSTDQEIVDDDNFKADLMQVFSLFNELMNMHTPAMRGPQASALKNISSIFPDLSKIFTPTELSGIITRFVESIQYSPQLELLNKEKLLLINRIACSPVFLEKAARASMMSTLLYQLGVHLRSTHHEEILLCILILCVMLNAFQTKIKDQSGFEELLTLLPHVMNALRTLKEDSENVTEPIVCFLTMLKLTPPNHFQKYLEGLNRDSIGNGSKPTQNRKTAFLLDVFTLLQDILNGTNSPPFQTQILAPATSNNQSTNSNAPPLPPPLPPSAPTNSMLGAIHTPTTPFPERWVMMNMFSYGSIMKFTDHIAKYLTSLYKENPASFDFSWPESLDFRLWTALYNTALAFMKVKQLSLEEFPPTRRNLVQDRYGEMRQDMGDTLWNCWNALSNAHKLKFLPFLVGPSLHLMMLLPPFVKEIGVQLYYNLFEVEMAETKATKAIEAQTIDTLDTAAYEASLPPNFNTYFVTKLNTKFSSRQDDLSRKGAKFIEDITYLLDLLMDLSALPTTPQFEEDRVVAIVKLMEYLHQTGRHDSYLKYVHMLESIHTAGGNYGEAAYTVLLHGSLLQWDDTSVPPMGMYGRDTSRGRKEKLYHQAIEYFDKGKLWEEAIKLIKELRLQYEHHTYDYSKLADLLELQASLVKKIITIERFFPEYFRVAYYGKGFDPKYQGKEFVYRGYELEGRSEFLQRIQTRFPSANVLPYTEIPQENVQKGDGQQIQVFAVKPSSPEERDGLEKSLTTGMPLNIAKYYQTNSVKVFLYSKPFRKTKEKSDNEFKDLWIRNSYYSTPSNLPGILRRCEITKVTTLELSPIHNAINTIDSKNNEIVEALKKYGSPDLPPDVNISPLTMLVKGTIDAAVNGGPEKYKEAFMISDYVKSNPDHKSLTEKLKLLLKDHMTVLERVLIMHGRVCGPALGPLQESLEFQFNKMKATEMLTYY